MPKTPTPGNAKAIAGPSTLRSRLSEFLGAKRDDKAVPEPRPTVTETPPERAKQTPPSLTPEMAVIMNAVPNPIILIDKRRNVLSANTAAMDLLGETVTGRDLCLSLRQPQAKEVIDTVLDGEAARRDEILIPVPMARTFSIEAKKMTSPIPGAPAAVVILQDTTVVKRTQAMRSEFVANVSHELRSPLSVLIGFFETLRGPAQDDVDARNRFLDIMENEALRMSRLIDDLLSLSKIESKEHIRPDTDLSAFKLLNEVVSALSIRAKDSNVKVVLKCPDDLPAIHGDKDELVQVFHNLIVNAIKYGGPDQTVTISATAIERIADKGRPGIAITVADQGEGIPAEHVPRLTERFYRIDKGRSRELGGTGLGLAIVKHIVNRHSGRMTVSSEIGKGSEFTVYLPIHREPRG